MILDVVLFRTVMGTEEKYRKLWIKGLRLSYSTYVKPGLQVLEPVSCVLLGCYIHVHEGGCNFRELWK